MEFYVFILVILAFLNAITQFYTQKTAHFSSGKEKTVSDPFQASPKDAATFKKIFLGTYALAVAADWLQGPYIYTIYKNTHALSPDTVASLFATGFVSAALSASFTGLLADRFGRARACLSFCITYGLSCLSVLCNNMGILFLGRVLGGISATLLSSVFEAWMIAEHERRALGEHLALELLFSMTASISGVIAILSGIVGEGAVVYFGTNTAPFLIATGCLAFAALGISLFWGENVGAKESSRPDTDIRSVSSFRYGSSKIWAIGAAMTIFEAVLFMFVYFWTSAFVSDSLEPAIHAKSIPLGLIFSCFMCGTMLGSSAFLRMTTRHKCNVAKILCFIFATASASLLLAALSHDENAIFWSFLLFESCVGMYLPAMGYLKSQVVKGHERAQTYSMLRMPLNIAVVLCLWISGGDEANRDTVFLIGGGGLLVAIPIVWKVLANP